MGNAGIGFSGSGVTTPITALTVAGALNGVSLNGTDVVLGQDVGEPGDPAALANLREIPVGGFGVVFTAVGNGTALLANQSGLQFQYDSTVTGYNAMGLVIVDTQGTAGGIAINSFQDAVDVSVIGYQITGPFMRILSTSSGAQFGSQATDFDTNVLNALHIKLGTVISEETAFVRRVGNTQTIFQNLTRYTSGTFFQNDDAGAGLNVQLPPAANNGGVWCTLAYNNAAAGGSVVATPDGTDYIIIDGAVGAAGAAAQATLRGASITLVCDGVESWIAVAVVGTWVV